MNTIRHPNVVNVKGMGYGNLVANNQCSEVSYIIMELVPSGELYNLNNI